MALKNFSFSCCCFTRPPIIRTQQDGRVWLHPKSVNAQVTVFEDNWLIYHEKMKSSSVRLLDLLLEIVIHSYSAHA